MRRKVAVKYIFRSYKSPPKINIILYSFAFISISLFCVQNPSHHHWTEAECCRQGKGCSVCSNPDPHYPPNWNNWRSVEDRDAVWLHSLSSQPLNHDEIAAISGLLVGDEQWTYRVLIRHAGAAVDTLHLFFHTNTRTWFSFQTKKWPLVNYAHTDYGSAYLCLWTDHV